MGDYREQTKGIREERKRMREQEKQDWRKGIVELKEHIDVSSARIREEFEGKLEMVNEQVEKINEKIRNLETG